MAELNGDIPEPNAEPPIPGALSPALPRLSIARFAPDPAAVDAILGRPDAPAPTAQEAPPWPTPRPSRP